NGEDSARQNGGVGTAILAQSGARLAHSGRTAASATPAAEKASRQADAAARGTENAGRDGVAAGRGRESSLCRAVASDAGRDAKAGRTGPPPRDAGETGRNGSGERLAGKAACGAAADRSAAQESRCSDAATGGETNAGFAGVAHGSQADRRDQCG